MNIIHLKETKSTNAVLMDSAGDFDEMTVAVAEFQSAGRGMGANTWESEKGQNLLYSILVYPTFLPVRKQYLLSMASALAVCDAVREIIPDQDVTIKWPNDIYVGNRKLSGTRIDLNIGADGIKYMVIGTGVNVNQREFRSDAPNPVSLWQVTGKEHSIDNLLDAVMVRFEANYAALQQGRYGEIMEKYHQNLYRRTGFHAYEDAAGRFEAELAGVQADGIMVLKRRDGTLSEYEFKEVRFVL